jgi:hypothetical protein
MAEVYPAERYSYARRRGVPPISWEDYFAICKGLAQSVALFEPDLILGIISEALILNPWDREIFKDGEFIPHPEYVEAFEQQGIAPVPPFLLDIAARKPDKAT